MSLFCSSRLKRHFRNFNYIPLGWRVVCIRCFSIISLIWTGMQFRVFAWGTLLAIIGIVLMEAISLKIFNKIALSEVKQKLEALNGLVFSNDPAKKDRLWRDNEADASKAYDHGNFPMNILKAGRTLPKNKFLERTSPFTQMIYSLQKHAGVYIYQDPALLQLLSYKPKSIFSEDEYDPWVQYQGNFGKVYMCFLLLGALTLKDPLFLSYYKIIILSLNILISPLLRLSLICLDNASILTSTQSSRTKGSHEFANTSSRKHKSSKETASEGKPRLLFLRDDLTLALSRATIIAMMDHETTISVCH